jgi:hypothetical protein
MFAAPSRSPLPIFTDNDSQPHAGAPVTILAALAQSQHALAQFVAHHPSRWWRRRSNNPYRRRSRCRAIFRRDHDPRSIGTLLVATLLVVTIAARPRLALRSDGGACGPADDRANRSPAPPAQCSA